MSLNLTKAYLYGLYILTIVGILSLAILSHAAVEDAGTYQLITHLPT